jgi:hypothetical protein
LFNEVCETSRIVLGYSPHYTQSFIQDRRSIILLFLAYRLSSSLVYNLQSCSFALMQYPTQIIAMKSPLTLVALLAALSSPVSASVLSTTNVANVLAGVHDQNALTMLAPDLAAIKKLGTGGDTANALTASDKIAISDCVTAARAGNTASKGGLGSGTGTAGNIAL